MNHRERRFFQSGKPEKKHTYEDHVLIEKPSRTSRKERIKRNKIKHLERTSDVKAGQSGRNLHYLVDRKRHDFE